MSFLPVKQYEYDRSLLLTDFIGKIRDSSQKNSCVSDLIFIPKVNGYEINYSSDGVVHKIEITTKGILCSRLRIRKYEDNLLKGSYSSKSKDDNLSVIQNIFK